MSFPSSLCINSPLHAKKKYCRCGRQTKSRFSFFSALDVFYLCVHPPPSFLLTIRPNLTWSHPWASSPAFLVLWNLFGITPTSPGWATVRVRPAVGDLTSGTVRFSTLRGFIEASFVTDKTSKFSLSLRLPGGVELDVDLPLPLDLDPDSAVKTKATRGGDDLKPRAGTTGSRGYVSLGRFRGPGRYKFSVSAGSEARGATN